jgi:WhiB family redox-sensing transcriptional regulator
MRRGALQKAVDEAARCRQQAAGADDFFRQENEDISCWRKRRADALRMCGGCLVMNACRELALRDRDGYEQSDELVRGGLSGQELFATRLKQRERLEEARAADRDIEWERLVTTSRLLWQTAGVATETGRRGRAVRATQNITVRKLAEEVRTMRLARRARTGWGQAA